MPTHFRTIPRHVQRQMEQIGGSHVVAGCLVVVKSVNVSEGELSHLDISLDDAGLHYQQEVLPSPLQGKFSNRNTNGWVETRSDWPKERYSVLIEAPNWNGSGTHTVLQSRERFPKLHHAPKFSTIRIACADSSPGRDSYSLKCEVSDVLDPNAPDFEEHLLACINLLQENVGLTGVAKPNATFADYARSLRVTWDVLPPGTKEDAIQRIFGARTPTAEQRSQMEDRYTFLMSFNPHAMIYGRSGLQRYFGAQLQDDIVLFENVEHGNAIYVMFEDWEHLSQKSRVELLSGRYGQGFERVVHTGDWKARTRRIVQMRKRAKNR